MSNGHPVRPQALSLFLGAQLQSIPQLPALRWGGRARGQARAEVLGITSCQRRLRVSDPAPDSPPSLR